MCMHAPHTAYGVHVKEVRLLDRQCVLCIIWYVVQLERRVHWTVHVLKILIINIKKLSNDDSKKAMNISNATLSRRSIWICILLRK